MSMNMYTFAGDCPSNEKLALRIQGGDKNAAELLISQNEGYITELALKHGEWCDLEDLKQEGALVLLEAVKRFDPAYGTKLLTYATPAMESAQWTVAPMTRSPSAFRPTGIISFARWPMSVRFNCNGPSGAEKAYKTALRKLKKELYSGDYGPWLSIQKAINKAGAEADPGHYTAPQITWLDEKELTERFFCEVVSLIQVHEIFGVALENEEK